MRKIIFYTTGLIFLIFFIKGLGTLLMENLGDSSYLFLVLTPLMIAKSYLHEFGHYILGRIVNIRGMKLQIILPAIKHKEWDLFAKEFNYKKEELIAKYEHKDFVFSDLPSREKVRFIEIKKKIFISTIGGPGIELLLAIVLFPFIDQSTIVCLLFYWVLFGISLDMTGSDGETIFEYLFKINIINNNNK